MTNALAPTTTLTAGTRFVNGNGLHSYTFNWSEPLTIVRHEAGYGVTRYTVTDRYGRHGYAY